MAKLIRSSTSYSRRQLDLESLQSMRQPSTSYEEVVPSATYDTPKIVAGIQKLVQRYAILFTTVTGSDVMRPTDGTGLYGIIDSGNVGSTASIKIMANRANAMVKSRIRADDDNEDVFGRQPSDEKLDDCWISRVSVDTTSRSVSVYASIRSVAGSEVEFIVPTSAGIY